MEGDINKLPRWARVEIDRLRSNVDYYHDAIVAMNMPDSAIQWSFGDIERGLPEDSQFSFKIRGGRISIHLLGNTIDIRGISDHNAELITISRSSNSIRVALVDPSWEETK